MSKEKIESKTADTVLQRPKEIKLPWGDLQSPPPTLATLILVSEQIAALPEFVETNSIATDALRYGRHARQFARIAAICLLGAKKAVKTVKKRRWPMFWKTEEHTVDATKTLTDRLLKELSPAELNDMLAQLLSDLQLKDFFSITTFLTGINLTKRTKVESPTQSGQQ